MAFHGYELNLMLRVQDRASSRLRRLSHDLGGVNRAAQLQRDAGRLASTQTRNQLATTRTLVERESLLSQKGAQRLQYEAQMLRLKAQEVVLNDKIARMSPGARVTPQGQAIIKRAAAVQKDIIRLDEVRRLAIRGNNQALADQLLLEEQIKREIQQIAVAQLAAEKAARAQQRARTLTHVGSAAIIAGGVGLAASAATASQAANFNRQTVGAATQMRGLNASFTDTIKISRVLESSLLDLTRRFPASAEEMSKSIYDIASGMNFQIDRTSRLTETQQRYTQSMRILKLANETAVAGNLDLNTATDVLITTFNNFDPAVRNPVRILNELFAIVRFGKGTFAEFAPQIGRLAASARAAGQSLRETGGALAFLSQRMPLSQATTALTRIFQIVGRPEFTAGFQKLFNMSALKPGTRQLRDLSDLMFIIEKQGPKIWPGFTRGSVDLMNVLRNITAAGQDMIKGTSGHVGLQSTEFARKAITNFIVSGEQYRRTLQDVMGTQGEFFRSLEAFRNQPGVQWQIAINQFKAFGIIIGQTVLPAVLRFFDWINKLIDRFRNLSPHTQHMIGQFAAWGSIITFVGGIVTTFVGGLAILVTSMRVLSSTIGTEGEKGLLGRSTALLGVMRGLVAIGGIAISIKTSWSGNPKAMDFLQGAMAGALAGSIFGPEGAIIGGITMPVIMKIIANFKKPKEVLDPVHAAYQDYINQGRFHFRWFWESDPKSFSQFQREWNANLRRIRRGMATGLIAADAIERHRAELGNLKRTNTDTTSTILKNWQDLASQLTGLDVFSGVSQSAATAAANVQLALAKALATGDTATQRRAIRNQIASDQKAIQQIMRTPVKARTAEQVKQLIQLWNDIAAQRARLTAMDNAAATAQTKATAATRRHNAELERHKKAIERANNAYKAAERRVDAIKLKLKQLKSEALDKLRSAFGDIFGGPFMQGPIGSAFTGIANTLAGFGQTFAIPAQFILKDQEIQQKNFDQLNKDLTYLSKRGVDAATIQNIVGQGASALPFLEGIRKGTPAQQAQFIKNLRERGKSLTEAMQSPWQKQITASNTQLQAARMQLKAAHERVAATKRQQGAARKTTTTTAAPTRTTQSVVHHHGDTVTIKADGATPTTVKSALDRHAFDKRHRR